MLSEFVKLDAIVAMCQTAVVHVDNVGFSSEAECRQILTDYYNKAGEIDDLYKSLHYQKMVYGL